MRNYLLQIKVLNHVYHSKQAQKTTFVTSNHHQRIKHQLHHYKACPCAITHSYVINLLQYFQT